MCLICSSILEKDFLDINGIATVQSNYSNLVPSQPVAILPQTADKLSTYLLCPFASLTLKSISK